MRIPRSGGSPAAEAALLRFECPRCAGTIHSLRDVSAVACTFCGGRFLLGDTGDVGWMMEPRVPLAELAEVARRHLRETRRRITRLEPPQGLLLPVYWARGLRLEWALLPASDASEPGPPAPGTVTPWEANFDTAVYRRTVPAHPLAARLAGVATRLDAGVLVPLDPDRLPDGYRALTAPLSREEAEGEVAHWQEGKDRRSSVRGIALAAVNARHRMNRVAMPAALVPFAFRSRERGAVLVDALSGRVRDVLEGDALPAPGETVGPGGAPGPELLIPLECACGWELALRERDALQPCPHCGACWELSGGRRRKVRQWVLDAAEAPACWLPFWIFGAGGGEDTPPVPATVVPAYLGRHPVPQLHLAARLCRRFPGEGWSAAWGDRYAGAAVGSEEGRAWHWAVTGALSRENLASFRRFLDTPPAAAPSPAGLGWIPFLRSGGDLTEPRTGARVREEGTRPWRLPRAA